MCIRDRVNSMVQSIVEDREGKLWVATEYGISRFDPDTHACLQQ